MYGCATRGTKRPRADSFLHISQQTTTVEYLATVQYCSTFGNKWPMPRAWVETPTHKTKNPTPNLRKSPHPPLSYPGATPDSDRATKPPLSEPSATGQELNPGDRVEGLGNFGKPTGEFGTVEQANEDDAVVKWDDDGRMRVHQPSLKKV